MRMASRLPPPFLTWSPRRESRSVGWVWWGECPTHRPPSPPPPFLLNGSHRRPFSIGGKGPLTHSTLSIFGLGGGGQSQGTEGRTIDQMKMEREKRCSLPKRGNKSFLKKKFFLSRAHTCCVAIYIDLPAQKSQNVLFRRQPFSYFLHFGWART